MGAFKTAAKLSNTWIYLWIVMTFLHCGPIAIAMGQSAEPPTSVESTAATTTTTATTTTPATTTTTRTAIDPCLINPCLNGGTCISGNDGAYICVCPEGLTGSNCEIVEGSTTLLVTVKDTLSALYVDGLRLDTPNGGVWQTPDTIALSPDARLIAIRAFSTSDYFCPGILASVTDDYLVTSSVSWKCSPTGGTGFQSLGYDDTAWPSANQIGRNGDVISGCPSMTQIPQISGNAYWIWTSNAGPDTVVYCRGYLPLCELNSPCQNNGTCLPNSQELCICEPGYSGKYCEWDLLHPCSNYPCLNNATCFEQGDEESNSTGYRCNCPLAYTGVNCETHVTNMNLSITAKEVLGALYIDGYQIIDIDYPSDWRTPMVSEISLITRLIAVAGTNINNTCAGILASVDYDYTVTGLSWRCFYSARLGWSNLEFDDSGWTETHVVGGNDDSAVCAGMGTIPGISQNAQWIWTDPTLHDLVVYCRGYLPVCEKNPCRNGGTCNQNKRLLCSCLPGFVGTFCEIVQMMPLTITAREELNVLYVDGKRVPIQNGSNWRSTDLAYLFPTSRLIAVMATDVNDLTGGCYGMIASVGEDNLVTNSSWKCTLTARVGWFKLGFDDGDWPAARTVGNNTDGGRCSDVLEFPGISSEADWIWTNTAETNYDLVAFCRGYLRICDSKPCQHGGTCNDNAPSLCTCAPNYTGTYCEYRIGYDVPAVDGNGVTDFDKCLSQPCLNGGKCEDLFNEYRCVCAGGYSGKNCESKWVSSRRRRPLNPKPLN